MTVGIELYNTSGIIQITSATPNWCFIQKLSIAIGNTFTITANFPFIFIKTNDGNSQISCLLIAKNSNQYTFKIAGFSNYANDVYIFDRLTNTSHNVGFEIYGDDGSSCYSGDNRPLKIYDIFNIAYPEPPSKPATAPAIVYSLPSGNWAASLLSSRYSTTVIGNSVFRNSDLININNNVLTITHDAINGSNIYGSENMAGQIIVADITGL